jgi:integrase
MAVERLKSCDNIVALAQELGVHRRLLYKWRDQLEPMEESEGALLHNSRVATLRKEVSQLKRVLADKVVEVDLPEVKDQRTPTFSAEEISTIISKAEGQYQVLYSLLAGTGLRIEEAFALQVEDIEHSVIRVRHSMWNGKLYSPKTAAGVREVDIHTSLAELLHNHLTGRSTGFVFRSAVGTPLARSNVLRRSLHKILGKMGREKCGFHAFRRYRVTHLRKQRVPEDLLRFWIGHADGSVTDGYSKVKEDVEFRRFTAEQAGLGFHMPTVVPKLPVAPIAPKTAGAEIALTA